MIEWIIFGILYALAGYLTCSAGYKIAGPPPSKWLVVLVFLFWPLFSLILIWEDMK